MMLTAILVFFKAMFKRLLMKRNEVLIRKALNGVGVTINGSRTFDIQVLDIRFYILFGTLDIVSFGEAYIFGWWDCKDPVELMCRLHGNNIFHSAKSFYGKLHRSIAFWLLELTKAEETMLDLGDDHYKLGTEFLECWRDSTLSYSCGYWKKAKNAEESQQHKMDLIARKLKLKSGHKILDIGCGWGSLCRYLANHYKVDAFGVDNCDEIVERAKEINNNNAVDIRLCNYIDLQGKYDRITCVEMFYNLSKAERRGFFEKVHSLLEDGGLFLLQTDGIDDQRVHASVEFEFKYVYIDGNMPVAKDILEDTEGLFVLEDWHNFGYDYYRTCMSELKEFDQNWPKVASRYGENYRRMGRFACIDGGAAFKVRKFQLWQIVFSKNGFKGGYESER